MVSTGIIHHNRYLSLLCIGTNPTDVILGTWSLVYELRNMLYVYSHDMLLRLCTSLDGILLPWLWPRNWLFLRHSYIILYVITIYVQYIYILYICSHTYIMLYTYIMYNMHNYTHILWMCGYGKSLLNTSFRRISSDCLIHTHPPDPTGSPQSRDGVNWSGRYLYI